MQRWRTSERLSQRLPGVDYVPTSVIRNLAGSLDLYLAGRSWRRRRRDERGIHGHCSGHFLTATLSYEFFLHRATPTHLLVRQFCRCSRSLASALLAPSVKAPEKCPRGARAERSLTFASAAAQENCQAIRRVFRAISGISSPGRKRGIGFAACKRKWLACAWGVRHCANTTRRFVGPRFGHRGPRPSSRTVATCRRRRQNPGP